MKPIVYLAGPVSHCSWSAATDWRALAREALAQHGIKGVSPMRGKEYLSHLEAISPHGAEYAHLGVLSLPRGVMTRDRFDATRCDVLLANLLGADRVSIGTVMEIAWADARRTPVVLVMEERGNPHEHMMIQEAAGFRLTTLDDALHVVHSILS
jgi:nucleoside 2-deoxyribosyltransferase